MLLSWVLCQGFGSYWSGTKDGLIRSTGAVVLEEHLSHHPQG